MTVNAAENHKYENEKNIKAERSFTYLPGHTQ